MKIALALTAFLFGCVVAVRWDGYNDPAGWGGSFSYNFNSLPSSGRVSKVPWSGDYWPNVDGGIAHRWQAPATGGNYFTNYQLYSRDELLNGAIDINILSPAEKYDILVGRYDYPLVKSERERNSPNDAGWEGICHGWAPAAIVYKEPGQATLTNGDGIRIPFASGDVKALLSYYAGVYAISTSPTVFLATRCNGGSMMSSECWDANPGTIHVLFANLIGRSQSSFIVDVTQGADVWNQPLVSYSYSLGSSGSPRSNSAAGTAKTQEVVFNFEYTAELQPSVGTQTPSIVSKTLYYSLDLSADGTILGGDYVQSSNSDWIDFLWMSTPPAFYGYFADLERIYRQAIGGAPDTTTRSTTTRSTTTPRTTTTDSDETDEDTTTTRSTTTRSTTTRRTTTTTEADSGDDGTTLPDGGEVTTTEAPTTTDDGEDTTAATTTKWSKGGKKGGSQPDIPTPTIVKNDTIKYAAAQGDAKTQTWLVPNPSKDKPLQLEVESFQPTGQNEVLQVFESKDGKIGAPIANYDSKTKTGKVIQAPKGNDVFIAFSKNSKAASRVETSTVGTRFGSIGATFQINIL